MVAILSLNFYYILGGAILCIAFMLIVKAYYASAGKNKIRKYQNEIARSHARILKLEMANEELKKKLEDIGGKEPVSKIRIA